MPKSKRRATRPQKHQSSSARRGTAVPRKSAPARRVLGCLAALGAVAVVAIAVVVLVRTRTTTGVVAPATASAVSTAAPTLARRIDNIPCNAENVTYHVHAHLQILSDGHNVIVPANIGIDDNTCVYYLHTHDNSGELHVEAPTYRYFTLGNFFDIWGQPLSRTRLASLPARRGQYVRALVNGSLYAGNPRAIELKAHRLIALELGPPFVQPATFDFQGD